MEEIQLNRRQDPDSPLEAAVNGAIRQARRVIVAVIGGTVVLAGIIMIVTPGPAMVLIPMGLAILAIEFAWARRLLKRVKNELNDRFGDKTSRDAPPSDSGSQT